MAEEKKEEKKIIIDEDWKQEAQKEKEILAAQEEAEKEKTQDEERPRGPLPEGNFAALVSMLTTQALFALGLLQFKGQEEVQYRHASNPSREDQRQFNRTGRSRSGKDVERSSYGLRADCGVN